MTDAVRGWPRLVPFFGPVLLGDTLRITRCYVTVRYGDGVSRMGNGRERERGRTATTQASLGSVQLQLSLAFSLGRKREDLAGDSQPTYILGSSSSALPWAGTAASASSGPPSPAPKSATAIGIVRVSAQATAALCPMEGKAREEADEDEEEEGGKEREHAPDGPQGPSI